MESERNILDRLRENRLNEERFIGDDIDLLIKDEVEAIDGYNKVLNSLKSRGLLKNQILSLEDTLKHIRDEEKEHIEELNRLKKILLLDE